MKKDLTRNNNVLITGANSGIGYYIAKNLLESGYFVSVLDKDIENIRQLENTNKNLKVFKCDLRKEEEIEKSIKEIIQRDKKIDVLINNACICIFNNFENKSVDEISEEFNVNYFGYLRVIKNVLPLMLERGKGIIHNMSSGVGITGFPGIAGYSSTKGAIESLTRTLSLELRNTGVYANVMQPPLTNTNSSKPLGIPSQMMEKPEVVGEKLAKKIFSTKKIICPDVKTRISMFFTLHFPYTLGKLLSVMTEKANNEK